MFDSKYFNNHSGVISFYDDKSGLKSFVAIHNKYENIPSFGATRIWRYNDEKSAIDEAVRLSNLMSYKSALGGLPCGGAKAVIIDNFKDKKLALKAYAQKVNILNGSFVTGADVGVSMQDVVGMKNISRYMVGTKVDPAKYTVDGMILALKVALKYKFKSENFSRTYAIQGMGKIGYGFMERIYSEAQDICISDIDQSLLKNIVKDYPKVKIVDSKKITNVKADIFSPCALSDVINKNNISNLNFEIIIGGANCQLENNDLADDLFNKNILYIPDYVANAGGVISVFSEYENIVSDKKISQKIKIIENNVEKIIFLSNKKGVSTLRISNKMAESFFKKQRRQ